MCSAALALACAGASAATVYRWVDENGVVHYSDQPHQNAQTVEVKPQTVPSMDTTEVSTSSGAPPAQRSPYSTCKLARPENDEVFLNTDTVNARLRVEPALRPGDRVLFSLDGKQTGTEGTDITLKVVRGSHSLSATIEDAAGNTVCKSASVTFHVRQPSRLAPNPANRPRF